ITGKKRLSIILHLLEVFWRQFFLFMQVLSYALVSCVRLPIGRQVIRIAFAGRWVVGIGHPPAFWIDGGGLLIIRNETLPIHGGIPSLAKQNGITRTYGDIGQ